MFRKLNLKLCFFYTHYETNYRTYTNWWCVWWRSVTFEAEGTWRKQTLVYVRATAVPYHIFPCVDRTRWQAINEPLRNPFTTFLEVLDISWSIRYFLKYSTFLEVFDISWSIRYFFYWSWSFCTELPWPKYKIFFFKRKRVYKFYLKVANIIRFPWEKKSWREKILTIGRSLKFYSCLTLRFFDRVSLFDKSYVIIWWTKLG